MAPNPPPNAHPKLRLEQITTVWSMLGDPAQFIMRYAPAIQRYFVAIIPNRHDAEEAIQDFLLRVMKVGFVTADSERGRFRDYLKVAVRNAALAQLRQSSSRDRKREPMSDMAAIEQSRSDDDEDWIAQWRSCVLDRAWRALERNECRNPSGGMPHVTLRVIVEHPDEDSKTLAARAAALTGDSIKADTFRQRILRARRTFARLLVQEVAETLEFPSPDAVEDELLALGLMAYVRRYLPPDWRTRGVLPNEV